MISYELALKLKNAGFPDPENMEGYTSWNLKETHGAAYALTRTIEPVVIRLFPGHVYAPDMYAYIPTLSDLIHACGEDGIFLWKFKDAWCAKDIDPNYDCFSDDFIDDHFSPKKGSCPEEAVANLYLAINLHKEKN